MENGVALRALLKSYLWVYKFTVLHLLELLLVLYTLICSAVSLTRI